MFFSKYFNVKKEDIIEYGAIDISLVCDLPLFIDPMLLFNSKKRVYIKLHKDIIDYFKFLLLKTKQGVTESVLKSYFLFPEVKNNWLGFSIEGNSGRGFGGKFARFLADNLDFALKENKITKGLHIEKVLLLSDNSGKDKISDLMTNLILGYLASYTEKFARRYIDKKFLAKFSLECEFNYQTESKNVKTFLLPYIINKKGEKEYVLLTPRDILRSGEPTINKRNFLKSYTDILTIIGNDVLRTRINQYISVKLAEFLDNCKVCSRTPSEAEIENQRKIYFYQAAEEMPEIYDYYIKMEESKNVEDRLLISQEVDKELQKYYENSEILIKKYRELYPNKTSAPTSREELIERLKYFKHCIEDCDCYKILYDKDGNRIASEDDLNRLFRLVLFGIMYDVNFEGNNGRGEFDVKFSLGALDKTIAEFKLASNPHLQNIVKQVEAYEKASMVTWPSVYVIFFFSQQEYNKVIEIIAKSEFSQKLRENVILIDCRADDKESGSKIK